MEEPGTGIKGSVNWNGGPFNEDEYEVYDVNNGIGYSGSQRRKLRRLTQKEKEERAAASAARAAQRNAAYQQMVKEREEGVKAYEADQERKKAAWAAGTNSRAQGNLNVWKERANAAAARKDPYGFVYGEGGRRRRTRRKPRKSRRTRK